MANHIPPYWAKVDITFNAGDEQGNFFLGKVKVKIIQDAAYAIFNLNKHTNNSPSNFNVFSSYSCDYKIRAAFKPEEHAIQEIFEEDASLTIFPTITVAKTRFFTFDVPSETEQEITEPDALTMLEKQFFETLHILFEKHFPNVLD